MFDAIVISDLHLGSSNCEAKAICEFLDRIHHKKILTQKLILNGDVFDSIEITRITKNHWKVLSLIRKLSDHLEIVWLPGNHDSDPEFMSHLLGVTVENEYVLESGGKHVQIMHGHQFDKFIAANPMLTWIADTIYLFLQMIDWSHTIAKFAKKSSKTFLRNSQKIQAGSKEYARKKGCDIVCCGHTHHAFEDLSGPVQYYNSGCWTEKPCHYLTILDGQVEIKEFTISVPQPVPAEVEVPMVERPILVGTQAVTVQ